MDKEKKRNIKEKAQNSFPFISPFLGRSASLAHAPSPPPPHPARAPGPLRAPTAQLDRAPGSLPQRALPAHPAWPSAQAPTPRSPGQRPLPGPATATHPARSRGRARPSCLAPAWANVAPALAPPGPPATLINYSSSLGTLHDLRSHSAKNRPATRAPVDLPPLHSPTVGGRLAKVAQPVQPRWRRAMGAEEDRGGFDRPCGDIIHGVDNWGMELWRCCSAQASSDVLNAIDTCATVLQTVWLVSKTCDNVSRKEKHEMIVSCPFLLYLVSSQDKAVQTTSSLCFLRKLQRKSLISSLVKASVL
jgi:hypothetical protein